MTNRKGYLWLGLLGVVLLVAGGLVLSQYLLSNEQDKLIDIPEQAGVPFVSKIEKGSFFVSKGNSWDPFFIKGVNIGAGKPGAFPGELSITYDEYYRWFTYIAEMNANTIRVYTTLRPQFYNALLDFNVQAEAEGKSPIYLIHGVWVDENDVIEIEDAFGEEQKILQGVIQSGKEIIDILHGDQYLPINKGHADGTYTSDVSKYVIGWILGIEWEPAFVVGTDEGQPDLPDYSGKYLYTQGASPFEIFLAEFGDVLIDYEMEKYNMQRPLAFSNWVTTDPLIHPNEPYPNEDLVEVNVENIKANESYLPGMFASYHVYPYYPDSFSYQTDYIEYKGKDGKPNPYRAYLEEINSYHSIPVVISEFGIPASRGKAHENRITGFNQGFIDEKTQGEMVMHMMNDIHEAGLAGGIVFAWQDEWFKRTWNNNDLDLPDSRPYWSNTQTNEQHFGLLAFDPGHPILIDGEVEDWGNSAPILEEEGMKLYVKSDEAYVYVRVDAENYDFYKDTLFIPIDTLEGQGSRSHAELDVKFSREADFLLQINGSSNSRLYVDAYYDNYYFRYAVLTDLLERQESFHRKNSGLFNPIMLALSKEIRIPPDNYVVPFTGYETGLLQYGIADPEHPSFNSLNDFYYANGSLEIRIPWQLLNVMDPSQKIVIDDMHLRGKISPLKVDAFHFGIAKVSGGPDGVKSGTGSINMAPYSWETWDQPTFQERLKPSYFILQEGFKKLGATP